MPTAEFTEFVLREGFQFFVEGVPDVEQGEEVGVLVEEAAVGGIGFCGCFARSLAGILNRQSGSDDQNLQHSAFYFGLKEHTADCRIDR